jgi:hypothetical protein
MEFKELKIGDLFTPIACDEGCQPIVFVRTEGIFSFDAPSVNLRDGTFFFFDPDEKVLLHKKSVVL